MAAEFEIREENDLFRALEIILRDDWPEDQTVRFIDWPRFEVTLVGEKFDGGIPTRIMLPLLKIQRAGNRAYARSVYGDESVRLTSIERKTNELIVRVKLGSTTFVSEIAPILNSGVAAASNMSGTQTLIAILGVAAMFFGASVWKAYMNFRAEARRMDYRTPMTEKDIAQYKLIERLSEQNDSIAKHLADMNGTQMEFLKQLHEGDQLYIEGDEIVDGDMAKDLRRSSRPPAIDDRIDGLFTILSVQSGQVRDGIRIVVRKVGSNSKKSLNVYIPDGTLPANQIDDLQSGEWEKRPLHMRINVVRSGDRIVKATLVSAGLSAINDGER